VLRLGPEGGTIWSYAGQLVKEPRWLKLQRTDFGLAKADARRFRRGWLRPRGVSAGPLELFTLEPSGQEPDVFLARVTARAAYHLARQVKLRGLPPDLVVGTVRVDPELVDPKGDPLPPPLN
jgi:hypothetical protein